MPAFVERLDRVSVGRHRPQPRQIGSPRESVPRNRATVHARASNGPDPEIRTPLLTTLLRNNDTLTISGPSALQRPNKLLLAFRASIRMNHSLLSLSLSLAKERVNSSPELVKLGSRQGAVPESAKERVVTTWSPTFRDIRFINSRTRNYLLACLLAQQRWSNLVRERR